MEPVYIFTALIGLLVYYKYFRNSKHPNYPPGPTGLPLLGNIHQLGNRSALALRKWKQKYGNIFSLKLGLNDAIVINDPKLIKELFNESVFAGRHPNPVMLEMGGGNYGIINVEGNAWEEQRRFVIRTLRELGFAKSSMEGMILEEAKTSMDWCSKNQGIPFPCNRVFNSPVISSLWSIVAGEGGNEIRSEILKRSEQFMEGLNTAQKTGLFFAPILRYFIPEKSGWTSLKNAASALHSLCDQSIAQHKASLDVDCPKDLIDYYLIEIGKTKNSHSSFFGDTGIKNLKAVVLDLFVAGNESTSATLAWLLIYLSCHPDVQRKLIDEIQTVIGKSRLPSLADKQNLPYTEAVILEVFRKSTFAPIGLPHRILEDRMFHGYFLPKHTMLISNIDSALNDPEYWGDPENFRPERFLSEDGRKVARNEALIPFSVGKRQCLGKTVAEDTVFLFTTSIFQKFEVLPDPENLRPDLEPVAGLANLPPPFRVVMKELS